MEVTATDFKKNLGRYLEISRREDVYISKNGKVISRLTSPYADKRAAVEFMTGILPSDFDAQAALDARRAAI